MLDLLYGPLSVTVGPSLMLNFIVSEIVRFLYLVRSLDNERLCSPVNGGPCCVQTDSSPVNLDHGMDDH